VDLASLIKGINPNFLTYLVRNAYNSKRSIIQIEIYHQYYHHLCFPLLMYVLRHIHQYKYEKIVFGILFVIQALNFIFATPKISSSSTIPFSNKTLFLCYHMPLTSVTHINFHFIFSVMLKSNKQN